MNILVCDIETDSKNSSNAEMLEVYLAIYSNKKITKELLIRVKPRKWSYYSDSSVEIHGITYEEAMKGTPWLEAMKMIFDFLPEEPHYFLCHANRRAGTRGCYDHQVLSMHFNQTNSDLYFYFLKILPTDKIISTHSLAERFAQAPKNDLKTLCHHFNIKLKKHHSAKDDGLACLEIYKQFEDKIDLDKFVESDFYDTEYNPTLFQGVKNSSPDGHSELNW